MRRPRIGGRPAHLRAFYALVEGDCFFALLVDFGVEWWWAYLVCWGSM